MKLRLSCSSTGLFVHPVVHAAAAARNLKDVELEAGNSLEDNAPKIVLSCVYSCDASVRISVPKLKSATVSSYALFCSYLRMNSRHFFFPTVLFSASSSILRIDSSDPASSGKVASKSSINSPSILVRRLHTLSDEGERA